MKIDRLLSIVVYLLNRELASARSLAERFDVSIRTIQRDMDTINLAGIPIVSVQGPSGGYGIIDTYKMDRRLMSTDDLFYIITALNGICSSMDDVRIDDTLEKMKGLMPHSPADPFRERQEKLYVDFSMLGGGPAQREVFRVVQSAVDSGRLLRFIYTSNRMERVTRVVEPMTVVFKWRAWYLFAYCRLRDDYRLFRISRIQRPEVLDGGFSRRGLSFEDFSREYDPERTGKLLELVLRFSAEMVPLVEEFHNEEDMERSGDGSLVVRVRMPEDGWLYGYILGFGQFVEVLEPARLRNIIRESSRKITELYE